MYKTKHHDGLWLVHSEPFQHQVGVYESKGVAESVAREMNILAGEQMALMIFRLKVMGGVVHEQATGEAQGAGEAAGQQEQADAAC